MNSSLNQSGNAGHNIPPSPVKTEHSKNINKHLKTNLLKQNLQGVKKSVASGTMYPAFPLWSLSVVTQICVALSFDLKKV